MTFVEWAKQTAREVESNVPYELVKDIMVNAIRVATEEMLSNPAEADLDITGIGRFYLNHRICHNNFPTPEHPEYETYWTLHFKPARVLKEVFNGKRDVREMMIGCFIPLYPEYVYNEDGSVKKGYPRGITKNYKVKYDVKVVENYKIAYRKAVKNAMKNNIKTDEND